jgi:hypothetical protein
VLSQIGCRLSRIPLELDVLHAPLHSMHGVVTAGKAVVVAAETCGVHPRAPHDLADEPGDSVLAIETDRGVLLTPYDPATERALEAAGRAAKRYRHVLRQLAK